MPSTYAFREAVFNTPNLVGVFSQKLASLVYGLNAAAEKKEQSGAA